MRRSALALSVLALVAWASWGWTEEAGEWVVPVAAPDTIPAFPEARGHGATALATCRGLPLATRFVTTRDSVGAGSWREAVETPMRGDSLHLIIFRVAGLFTWEESGGTPVVADSASCVYIAGQTAPGEGATIHYRFAQHRFDHARDLVLRGMRFSRGQQTQLWFRGPERVVVDQVTTNWGNTFGGGHHLLEAFGDSINYNARDVTFQRIMAYEPDSAHAMPIRFSNGTQLERGHNPQRMSLFQSFMASVEGRAPMMNVMHAEAVNNIVYNWAGRAGETNGAFRIDFEHNWYKPGPLTSGTSFRRMPLHLSAGGCGGDATYCTKLAFVAGNHSEATSYAPLFIPDTIWEENPLRQVGCGTSTGSPVPAGACDPNTGPVPRVWEAAARNTVQPYWPTPRLDLDSTVIAGILADAGASWRLGCDGSPVRIQSASDSTQIAQFWAGTGPAQKVRVHLITVPTPASGTACLDSDGDGIPDEWEFAVSGDSTGVRADSVSVSGYLMIEHYLNASDPDDPAPWGAVEGEPTFFAGTDSAFFAYRLARTTQLFIHAGGAETIQFRAPHPDTFAGRRPWQLHRACTVGDTILVTTRDTLALKAPLDTAGILAWASTHSLPGCSPAALRASRVRAAWLWIQDRLPTLRRAD